MSSDVSAVTSHFASPNEGFSTTSSAPVNSGATSVGLTGTTGLTNATVFVGIIEPGGTKEQVFTGTVDTGGSQITGVKWTKGTNVDHATGVTIVDYVTGTGLKMMTKGLLVAHEQTGIHKSGAAYAAPVFSGTATGTYTLGGTPSITSPAISSPTFSGTGTFADNFIPANALASSAITLGYAEITSSVTKTSPQALITGLTKTVTIPAGSRFIVVMAYVPLISSDTAADVNLTVWDGTVGSGTKKQHSQTFAAVAGTGYSITPSIAIISGLAAGSKTYNIGGAGSAGNQTYFAATGQPAFIWVAAI